MKKILQVLGVILALTCFISSPALAQTQFATNSHEPLTLTDSLRGDRDVRENYQIFHLTGLLDAYSERAFRKQIGKCIDEGPANIILNLSDLDFVDSSGLGALVQLVKKAQNAEGSLQIVSNPRVTQTVKLARLEKFLSLRNSIQEAISVIEYLQNKGVVKTR